MLARDIPVVIYADAAEPGGTTGYMVQLARGIRVRVHRRRCVPSGNLLAPMRTPCWR
jgi:hypothetical protein